MSTLLELADRVNSGDTSRELAVEVMTALGVDNIENRFNPLESIDAAVSLLPSEPGAGWSLTVSKSSSDATLAVLTPDGLLDVAGDFAPTPAAALVAVLLRHRDGVINANEEFGDDPYGLLEDDTYGQDD